MLSRMPVKEQYLVRGPDGRMSTIIAQSVNGALDKWEEDNSRLLDKWIRDYGHANVKVKPRLHGQWKGFKIK